MSSRKRNLSTLSDKISVLSLKLSNQAAVNTTKLCLTARCCSMKRIFTENSTNFDRIQLRWSESTERFESAGEGGAHPQTVEQSGDQHSEAKVPSATIWWWTSPCVTHMFLHTVLMIPSLQNHWLGCVALGGTFILGWLKSGNLLLTDNICCCTRVMRRNPSEPNVRSGFGGCTTGAFERAAQIRRQRFNFLFVFQRMHAWKR